MVSFRFVVGLGYPSTPQYSKYPGNLVSSAPQYTTYPGTLVLSEMQCISGAGTAMFQSTSTPPAYFQQPVQSMPFYIHASGQLPQSIPIQYFQQSMQSIPQLMCRSVSDPTMLQPQFQWLIQSVTQYYYYCGSGTDTLLSQNLSQ